MKDLCVLNICPLIKSLQKFDWTNLFADRIESYFQVRPFPSTNWKGLRDSSRPFLESTRGKKTVGTQQCFQCCETFLKRKPTLNKQSTLHYNYRGFSDQSIMVIFPKHSTCSEEWPRKNDSHVRKGDQRESVSRDIYKILDQAHM